MAWRRITSCPKVAVKSRWAGSRPRTVSSYKPRRISDRGMEEWRYWGLLRCCLQSRGNAVVCQWIQMDQNMTESGAIAVTALLPAARGLQ